MKKVENDTRIRIGGNEVVATKNIPEIPYFLLIGETERKKVEEWFNKINSKICACKKRQREFLDRVGRAIHAIDYDYYIATLEPSFDKKGNIFYKEGEIVARGISPDEWKKKAVEFYSYDEWHSELARLEEGDLFKAYRIAMGYWTIEYVCDNSSSAGNYLNVPDSSQKLEVSGARVVGGFKDGIGNTCEIYRWEYVFASVGGYYGDFGYYVPVSYIYYDYFPFCVKNNGAGVLVIKRNTIY